MKNKKKKIIIYGGSFSPPHIGHIIAIEAAIRNFLCDEIWIMPSSERLDKRIAIPGEHRMRMLAISLREFFPRARAKIKIKDIELRRPRLTTTYDTKQELEKKYPRCVFYFLIGSELLWDIENTWVKGKELWRTANFLAVRKPDEKIPHPLPKNVQVLEKGIIWLNISSTRIRELIGKGYEGVPYIHPRVARYIKRHRLYMSQTKEKRRAHTS